MEALDTLLVTCHAHTLNLFVESFLKMVQKLLECNEPELQCLATSSVCDSLRIILTQSLPVSINFWTFLVISFVVCEICQHTRRHSIVPQTIRLLYRKIQCHVSQQPQQAGRERKARNLNLRYIKFKFKNVIVVRGYVKVYHEERIVVMLMVRHVFPHMLWRIIWTWWTWRKRTVRISMEVEHALSRYNLRCTFVVWVQQISEK